MFRSGGDRLRAAVCRSDGDGELSAGLAGFEVTQVIPRFLPYTVKSAGAAARRVGLVRLYLRLPWVWPLLGRQMLVVGTKPSASAVEPISEGMAVTSS